MPYIVGNWNCTFELSGKDGGGQIWNGDARARMNELAGVTGIARRILIAKFLDGSKI